MINKHGGPGALWRLRGFAPEAEAPGGEGAGAGGAGAGGAEKKPEQAAATSDKKPEVKAEPARAAEPAKAEQPKGEPAKIAEPAKAEPAKARDEELLERVAAVERRIAREKRDAALDYLKRVPTRLTDEQLRALAPEVDVSTRDGQAKLDKWREQNANLFESASPRPDQIVADLEKKLITEKTDPLMAERARRLTKSLWGGR